MNNVTCSSVLSCKHSFTIRAAAFLIDDWGLTSCSVANTLRSNLRFNGEGYTTLYELSRIGSSDTFAKIARQKYLTSGGPRLPHSKAEAWRKEYDDYKKSAEQKAREKNEKDAKKRAALLDRLGEVLGIPD